MPVETYTRFDVHAHVEGPKETYIRVMDAAGVKAVLNMSYSGFWSSERLDEYERALREDMDQYPGRFLFCASFSIHGVDEPDFAERTIAKLTRDFDEHGAVGVKVWKDLGMMLRDRNGDYVLPDDDRLSPIFEFIEARGKVLMTHLADPEEAWRPLDPRSPHYGYYVHYPDEHVYGKPGCPSREEILRHRDALVGRYPGLKVVGCHLASLEHELRAVAEFLDRFPNAMIDTAGRHRDLTGFPDDDVRDLFNRHQGRVLYGVDWEVDEGTFSADPGEREEQVQRHARGFAEAYRYYEEVLALSPEVLRKFYWENAAGLLNLPEFSRR